MSTGASIRSGLRGGKRNPRAVPEPQPSPGDVTVDLEGFWETKPPADTRFRSSNTADSMLERVR